MKIKIIFISLYFFSICAYSQDYGKGILPPSPTAASFGKYNNFPVSHFTGLVDISIPLFDFKDGDIDISAKLSYHSSGIKVEEVPSFAGLGWTMHVGGIITRSVRGIADEYYEPACPPWMNNEDPICSNDGFVMFKPQTGQGYFYVSNYIQDEKLFNNWCLNDQGGVVGCWNIYGNTFNGLPYWDEQNIEKAYNTQISRLNLDTEPDMFTFSFNGYSGSFFFNENRQIVKVPNNNLIINATLIEHESISDDHTRKSIESFDITTPEGFKYFFESVEYYYNKTRTESPYPVYSMRQSFTSSYTKSSWMLTKIVSPLNNQVVYTYEDDISDEYEVIPKSSSPNEEFYKITNEYIKMYGKRLSKIESSNFVIDFIKCNVFKNNYSSPAIKKIKILDRRTNETKNIDFEFSYFNSIIPTGTPSSDLFKFKRLRLDRLTIDLTPPYEFFYNEEVNLPAIDSYESDLWGYYNANGSTTGLIPKVYIYPQLSKYGRYRIEKLAGYPEISNSVGSFGKQYIINGIDRSVYPLVNQAWILKKIKLPTGGNRSFEYEPNDYFDEEINSTVKCGGLRIKKQIISTSLNQSNDIIEEFNYNELNNNNSSGKLINKPVVAFPIYKAGPYMDNNQIKYEYHYSNSSQYTEQQLFENLTMRTSHSQNGLEEHQGSPVGYTRVTKTNSNGKSVYYYSFPLPFGVTVDSTSFNVNLTKPYVNRFPINGFKTDNFLYEGDYSAPFSPNSLKIWRGILVRKEDYNTNEKKVYEEIANYRGIRHANYYSILPAIKFQRGLFGSSYVFYNPLESYQVVLYNKTTTEYDKNGQNPITNTEHFNYNNKGLISEHLSSQSDGSTLTTEYRYPTDFIIHSPVSNESTDIVALRSMISKNMISSPVEVVNYNNDLVIGGKLTLYKNTANGTPLPITNYNLETSNPLPVSLQTDTPTTFTPSSIKYDGYNFYLSKDNSYAMELLFDKYDDSGNLLQYHREGDIPTSYIWGYTQTLPVAVVKNAKYDEVHYIHYEPNANEGIVYAVYGDSHTGNYSRLIPPGTFAGVVDYSMSQLTSGKYILSGWFKTTGKALLIVRDYHDSNPWITKRVNSTGGKWKYYEIEVDFSSPEFSGCSLVRTEIWNDGTSDVLVDEIRFRPANAEMTTYTHKPLVGVTSVTDNNNRSTYYEYDGLGRLKTVRDEDGNILEHHEYNYYQE